jgi:hypothetical protein
MSDLLFSEGPASSTPATGKVVQYAKTDGFMYSKDDAGVETKFGGLPAATQSDVDTGTSTTTAITPDLNRITLMATQTASTTVVSFTGIPSGTRRITVMGSGVSTNGTSGMMVVLGDAGGPELTGYTGGVGVGAATTAFTTGFGVMEGCVAANSYDFVMTITLQTQASFRWGMNCLTIESAAAQGPRQCIGYKALSAELTQLRVQMVNGTDVFDAGNISVCYER